MKRYKYFGNVKGKYIIQDNKTKRIEIVDENTIKEGRFFDLVQDYSLEGEYTRRQLSGTDFEFKSEYLQKYNRAYILNFLYGLNIEKLEDLEPNELLAIAHRVRLTLRLNMQVKRSLMYKNKDDLISFIRGCEETLYNIDYVPSIKQYNYIRSHAKDIVFETDKYIQLLSSENSKIKECTILFTEGLQNNQNETIYVYLPENIEKCIFEYKLSNDIVNSKVVVLGKSKNIQFGGNIRNLDLALFDSSELISTENMFSDCTYLTYIDFGELDTSKVTSMAHMFRNCVSLLKVDVSSFDTSNVVTMEGMFQGCSNLVEVDLSNFNTEKVYIYMNMFDSCFELRKVNLKGFQTENGKEMGYMFCTCSSLQSLDLSNFTITNKHNVKGMFQDCYFLRELKLDYKKAMDYTYMLDYTGIEFKIQDDNKNFIASINNSSGGFVLKH